MSEIAVEAEGLGKCFFLGQSNPRQHLRRALGSLVPAWRGPELEPFWALRDVSFRIGHGETVGIIGRNGAGKSTLLKVLSRVTKPTEGRARVNGRLGTLLEVGTGFHPELTGRDNIFLSGSILGMTHAEVAKKFDEIVSFAEVEQFIDTPVKRYSSGMYVRLAFAVASFLEPDVLIVDEVLAVGDAAFQRKSLGRLNEASAQQGRTILFVSHTLPAIRAFCKRVILLEKGHLVFDGPTEQGLERYLKAGPSQTDLREVNLSDRQNRTAGTMRFTRVDCLDEEGKSRWEYSAGSSPTLRFEFEAIDTVPDVAFAVRFRTVTNGEILTTIRHPISTGPMQKGRKGRVDVRLNALPLRPNDLSIHAWLGRVDAKYSYDIVDENVSLPSIRIVSDSTDIFERDGVVSLEHDFAFSPEP